MKPTALILDQENETAQNAPVSRLTGFSAAAIYGLVSMSAVLVNKALLSSWDFNFPLTMIACQMVISFCLLYSLKHMGFIEYDDWSLTTAQKVAPLALAHVTNVLLGLAALNLVDIPMFGVLRRTTVVFVLVMEYFVLGRKSSLQIIASTVLILLGAIVGGWGDLHFDPFGYALTFFVNFTTSLSLTLIPKLGTAANLNPFGLMLYQITISFPFVLFFIILTGEYQQVLLYEHLNNVGFQASFFLSSAQIFLLNYTLFYCTQLNSPLTTTVTGNIKNIGETALGFAFFDVPLDPINILGIFLGFLGSMVYSLIKYLEQPPAIERRH